MRLVRRDLFIRRSAREERCDTGRVSALVAGSPRIGSCVAPPGKFICIGPN
jgi:hypothetical protein